MRWSARSMAVCMRSSRSARDEHWRAILSLVFAFVAISLMVVGVTRSADVRRANVSWTPSVPETVPLLLIGGSPATIDATLPCGTGTETGELLLSTGAFGEMSTSGIEVRSSGNAVRISQGGRSLLSIPHSRRLKPCRVRIEYRGGVITAFEYSHHSRGQMHSATVFEPIAVSGLETQVSAQVIDAVGFRARFLTQPLGVSSSWQQRLIEVLGIGAAFFALLLGNGFGRISLNAIRRSIRNSRHTWRATCAWIVSGGATVLMLFVASILWPPHLDDGWALMNIRGADGFVYLNSGSNMSVFGWPLPQARIWEGFVGLASSQFTSVPLIKLVPILVCTALWLVMYQTFCRPRLSGLTSRLFVWAVFVVWASIWLVTLRAEPLVSLLYAGAFALSVSYFRKPRPLLAGFPVALAGLAMASHQTGWVVVLLVLPHVILVAQRCRAQSVSDRLLIGSSLLVSVAIGLWFVFWESSVSFFLSSVARFQSPQFSAVHNDSPLDEPKRWANLLTQDPLRIESIFIAVLVIGLAIFSVSFYRRRPIDVYVVVVSVISVSGLMFTSSKWSWHLAVAVVPLVACLCVALGIGRRMTRCSQFAVSAFILGLALLIIRYANQTRPSSLASESPMVLGQINWLYIMGVFGNGRFLILALVAIMTFGGLIVARFRTVFSSQIIAFSIFAVLSLGMILPLSMAYFQAISAAAKPSWTYARQNVIGLKHPTSACGAYSFVEPEYNRERPVIGYSSPFDALAAPCFSTVRVASGYYGLPQVFLGGVSWDYAPIKRAFTIHEVRCVMPNAGCFYFVRAPSLRDVTAIPIHHQ
jgi:hypothetical protein